MQHLSSIIREACVASVEESVYAAAHGAHQIELCSRLDLDGLSPGFELIAAVQSACSLPIKVMIRPRDGDFVYNDLELKKMQEEILWCKQHGINEIVLGLLTRQNDIDLVNLSKLAALAQPMEITFHKAFDAINDPRQGIEVLKKISNVKYILTSGQAATAWEGRQLLKEMVVLCADQIQLIVAGKVRPGNIESLHSAIGANYYHGRGIV